MLRMSLISYFECSEIAVEQLANGIRRVAEESNNRSPQFSINCRGVSAGNNSIYLDFGQLASDHPLITLHRDASAMVDELPGATLPVEIDYHHKIYLMEHSDLSAGVMSDALYFAQGAATDIGVPDVASAWRLVLLRYHSCLLYTSPSPRDQRG